MPSASDSTRRVSRLRCLSGLAAFLVAGLRNSGTGNVGAAEYPVVSVEEGIVYSKVGDKELQLDLARPEGEGPFPALVFIHGGGWQGGNRAAYRGEIEYVAARKGYVAITVGYRLTDPDDKMKARHPFPDQIHDVKAAIRWLRANASQYKVDPDHFGAIGASAGGHLSLLAGLTDAKSGLEGTGGHPEQSSRVQAVVNYFGPTDMTYYMNSEIYPKEGPVYGMVTRLLGGTDKEVPEQYRLASPIAHVTPDDPPVLTLQGDMDPLVPHKHAELLDEKMKAAGVPHDLVMFKGAGHGFPGESGKKAQRLTYEFFDKHLKTKPKSDAGK